MKVRGIRRMVFAVRMIIRGSVNLRSSLMETRRKVKSGLLLWVTISAYLFPFISFSISKLSVLEVVWRFCSTILRLGLEYLFSLISIFSWFAMRSFSTLYIIISRFWTLLVKNENICIGLAYWDYLLL